MTVSISCYTTPLVKTRQYKPSKSIGKEINSSLATSQMSTGNCLMSGRRESLINPIPIVPVETCDPFHNSLVTHSIENNHNITSNYILLPFIIYHTSYICPPIAQILLSNASLCGIDVTTVEQSSLSTTSSPSIISPSKAHPARSFAFAPYPEYLFTAVMTAIGMNHSGCRSLLEMLRDDCFEKQREGVMASVVR